MAAKQKQELGAAANTAMAGRAALAGTQAAGKAVAAAASRARLPLVAGGSLAAGLAGGLAVIKRGRNGHDRGAKLDLEGLVKAAQRVGSVGEEIGHLAKVVEQASGSAKKAK